MSQKCSKCDSPAVYLRRYTSEALCKSCLIKTTLSRVRRTINRKKMLQRGDRVAVAISGGKDSAVLLDVLHRIESNFPDSELIPVTIDEGIKGYRDEALESARALARSLGLKLEVRSFEDIFGLSLDEIVQLRIDITVGACSYCGVLRRRALNIAAFDIGADVIATGHNLDDEAQTIMMNMMRGDSQRMVRTSRPRDKPIEGLVSRIKPILELSERDVVAYSHHLELPYHDVPCPYYREAMRNDLRDFLNEMEHKRPGTLLAILRSGEAITASLEVDTHALQSERCEKCGEVTSGRICKVCRLMDELPKRKRIAD
ncbi:MAG: TIGR00269 family protein [Candidatus Thorarchaeota archaeon]|nr:TIGR00269 family protein [Candidatus Thorarchaeota archaeon]